VNSVFILWHTHVHPDDEEDDKLIGIYSSKKLAIEARERTAKFRGFSDNLDGFIIDEYKLDEDNWTTGFTSTTE